MLLYLVFLFSFFFVWVWGCLCLLLEDIRLFAFHLFSYNLRKVATRRFDDRQSLERARHELQKKSLFLFSNLVLIPVLFLLSLFLFYFGSSCSS